MPSVTVLLTVFNGERYLRSAIESILAQTYRDFEFLIVNDGSLDGSREIVDSYRDPRIRLVENERNHGLAVSLNLGLSLARGGLVARQDADDVSHRERLEQQVKALRNHPNVVLVGTQGRTIDEDGNVIGVVDRSCEQVSIRWYHLFDNPFIHSSVMFRRDIVMKQCGGYNESFAYAQDYALWSRLMQGYGVMNLPERLVDYRSHAQSSTGATLGGLALHHRRADFQGFLRRMIASNLFAVFGSEEFSKGEIALLSQFVLGVERGSVAAFLSLFKRLLGLYCAKYPEASSSADLRWTIARQYHTVASRLVPPSRRFAFRVILAAILQDWALFFWLPWPRVLALMTVGKVALGYMSRVRRYSRLLGAR